MAGRPATRACEAVEMPLFSGSNERWFGCYRISCRCSGMSSLGSGRREEGGRGSWTTSTRRINHGKSECYPKPRKLGPIECKARRYPTHVRCISISPQMQSQSVIEFDCLIGVGCLSCSPHRRPDINIFRLVYFEPLTFCTPTPIGI